MSGTIPDRLNRFSVGCFVAYAGIVALTYTALWQEGHGMVVWPAFGCLLSLLIRLPRRAWPVLIAGAFAVHVLAALAVSVSIYGALGIAAAEVVAVYICATLVIRETEGRIHFGTLRELARFAGAVIVAGIASGLVMAVPSFELYEPHHFVFQWVNWFCAIVLSAFLVGPVLLRWGELSEVPPTWERVIEFNLSFLTLLLVSLGLFQPAVMAWRIGTEYLFVPPLIAVWIALRFGVRGGTLATVAIAAISSINYPPARLVFDFSDRNYLTWMQAYIGSTILFSLPLGVLVAERSRVAKIRKLETRVYQLMSSGASLGAVLDALIRGLESHASDMLCSVLIYSSESKRLLHGAAPSLPAEYNNAVDGVEIGPMVGSCGTAVFLRERVVVDDIATSPLWVSFRDLALKHGLRACWSQPVMSPLGEVLGTLAMYYPEPRRPSSSDLQLIEDAAYLAGVALSRARVEQALQEREGAYGTLLASISGVTYRCGADSTRGLEQVSDRCTLLTGYTQEQLLSPGKVSLFGELVLAEDRAVVQQNCIEALRLNDTFDSEYRIKRKDGKVVWVWDRCQGVYDEAGKLLAIEGLLIDVTNKREAELAREQLGQQLRQAQKMEAVGTLAGGIAHDFNNMLGAMIGFAELARRRLEPAHPASEHVVQILKACARARDLVGQILTFSRKSDESRKLTSLSTVIDDVLMLLRASLPSSIHVRKKLSLGVPKITANESQIHQVILNLASNAVHAMRDKSGVLEVSLEARIIDAVKAQQVPGLSPGSYVVLAVRDTGTGMNEETKARIFDPFFTTKAVGEGTGLGLSVVHGIVQSHRGAIEVQSELGKGTTFTLYFPVGTGDAPGVVEVNTEVPRGAGQHILLLDDEEALVLFGTEILKELGYKVSGFTSGEEALQAFELDPRAFDLIVTDETMPGMSGVEFAAQAFKLRNDIPVVASSGHARNPDHATYKNVGIRWFLDKPYSSDALANVIHQALRSVGRI
ncbi:MAG: MASE1 domain-containing protein [Oligoflexia bacterium]|nr:MASE1 domain-containing protein [Oligoflexia bacterium]